MISVIFHADSPEVRPVSDMKMTVAGNISDLRRKSGLTQAELAEKLNYSDKAVSKWERGESIPDVTVLKSIADLFGVTVDYLLAEEHDDPELAKKRTNKRKFRNHALITGISILLVWFVATFIFINVNFAGLGKNGGWLVFVCSVPVSMIVWLVFNSIWFNRRRNFFIISCLMWSLLATVFLFFIAFGTNIWPLFFIGIPAQIIIIMWSGIKIKRK